MRSTGYHGEANLLRGVRSLSSSAMASGLALGFLQPAWADSEATSS